MMRRTRKLLQLPAIYPITDKKLARKSSHLEIIRELVSGGATLVQVRDRETPLRELLADVCRCAEFCERRGILLIINDRCSIAPSSNAGGVHHGQEDFPPIAARSLFGHNKVIGLSTESSSQIREANSLSVDYIGFGPVFPTATKVTAVPALGIEKLRRACSLAIHRVVAIGGIGLVQVAGILRAGAASAAVISSLMCAENLARRMEQLLRAATATR